MAIDIKFDVKPVDMSFGVNPSVRMSGEAYGLKGDPGTTFTPSVSEEGVISWTNDGGKENPTPVNIKGPKGDQGDTPDISGKADKADTVLETTLSRGRKANATVGTGSIAFGYNVEASGSQSQAFGNTTKASGSYARSEGSETIASGPYSTAEGYRSVARSTASHAEGIMSTANGSAAHSEGSNSKADGSASHSGGTGTVASHRSQHSFGEYNITDQSTAPATDRGTYIEIVGNGTGNNARSNARTLDWSGNEELAGDLTINKGSTNESSMSDVAEDVNSLKSALNVLDGDLYDKEEQTVTNVTTIPYADMNIAEGYMSYKGETGSADTYSHITFNVDEGDVVTYRNSLGSQVDWMFVCAFVNGVADQEKGSSSFSIRSYTVPSEVSSIAISVKTTNLHTTDYIQIDRTSTVEVVTFSVPDNVRQMTDASASDEGKFVKVKTVEDGKVIEWEFGQPTISVDATLTESGQAADAKVTGDRIDELAEITTEEKEVTTTEDVNAIWHDGFLAKDGTIHTDGEVVLAHGYTEKIPVLPGDIIKTYSTVTGTMFTDFRVLVAFNDNSVVFGNDSVPAPYTVPSNVNYIGITVNANNKGITRITRTRTSTILVPALSQRVDDLEQSIPDTGESNAIVLKFNLSGNDSYEDPDNRSLEDSCGYSLAFKCKIASNLSGQIVIGIGYGVSDGSAIGIDATNIYMYDNGRTIGNPNQTQAHGLTFKDYIGITLDVGYSLTNSHIRIKTNGGSYDFTPTGWRAQKGKLSCRSTVDAITEAELSYSVPALCNDIWMYGDSYFGWYNSDRWPYYLVHDGHTKFLLNCYPGRTSVIAYNSLLVDLSMNMKPDKIIWCLGMNDKDGNSAPNDDWLTTVESLKTLCESRNIELILSTVPNVPSTATKNTYKNAYVEASGYRYIDFAKAVSADGSSTWYDNMIYSDNVHPATEGAKAMYAAAVAEVPELLR